MAGTLKELLNRQPVMPEVPQLKRLAAEPSTSAASHFGFA